MFGSEYENDDDSLSYDPDEVSDELAGLDYDSLVAQHQLEVWEASRPVMTVQDDGDCPPF
jgi:hypothetical protein